MRNKNRITELERQIAELNEQMTMLVDIVTRPHDSANAFVKTEEWRHKPRNANKTENRMKSWSDEDIRLALTMREKGATNAAIGKVLGRSARGVSGMFFRYGLNK